MTTASVASAIRMVGRRIFHLFRHSAAPSAGMSKSASMNCPRNDGRCDCDATLISRLLRTRWLTEPDNKRLWLPSR